MEDLLSYEGYHLVFEDRFDGTELDRSHWNVELHEPGWVNEELQRYVDCRDNICLRDGKLLIRPIKTLHGDGSVTYTSGRITTQYKHDFALLWEPGLLRWYVDGRPFYEERHWFSAGPDGVKKPYPAPFDHDMYLILNLAVGGSWVGYPDETTDFAHAAFEAEYVRVYQKNQSSTEGMTYG